MRGLKDKGIMKKETLDKILTVILLIAIITALAMTVYIIVTPKKGEEFTEFYILGPSGKAADYPTDLSVGERGEVIVGVVNHEYENVSYLFKAKIENRTIGEKSFQLAHNETLEFPFVFTVEEEGIKKLEFLLFKGNRTEEPYRELHLWVNVQNMTFSYFSTAKIDKLCLPLEEERFMVVPT